MAEEIQHGDGQFDATRGDGVQPADLGYAPPDTGLGDSAESEIPVGVDALTDEQIQRAKENASGGDEGGEGGGDGPIDVAALMESGGADASGGDVEGGAADDAGEGAAQMTEPEAQVAPDTGGA